MVLILSEEEQEENVDGEEEGDDVEVEKDALPDPERPAPQVGVRKRQKRLVTILDPVRTSKRARKIPKKFLD